MPTRTTRFTGRASSPIPHRTPFTSNLVLSTSITASVRRCPAGEYYVEPASGFWIINPGTNLVGNSVGGCQGVGRAFWYVPPGLVIDTQTSNEQKRQELQDLKHWLVGQFKNNRGHACYAGLCRFHDLLLPHGSPIALVSASDGKAERVHRDVVRPLVRQEGAATRVPLPEQSGIGCYVP